MPAEAIKISLINTDTGWLDKVEQDKIKEFWDNLSDDDKIEMASWTYEAFLERLSTTYSYYIKRDEKIVAIGGTYPDYPYICLWLLVSNDIAKYPKALIKAVRKVIKKELEVYSIAMHTVLALPDDQSITHHRFIEKVLGMEFSGKYFEMKKVYKTDKQELLSECNKPYG